jgi:hypothetical protein
MFRPINEPKASDWPIFLIVEENTTASRSAARAAMQALANRIGIPVGCRFESGNLMCLPIAAEEQPMSESVLERGRRAALTAFDKAMRGEGQFYRHAAEAILDAYEAEIGKDLVLVPRESWDKTKDALRRISAGESPPWEAPGLSEHPNATLIGGAMKSKEHLMKIAKDAYAAAQGEG